MTRQNLIRLLVLLPILLTIMAWWRSASNFDRVAYGRGHACIAAGTNDGVLFFELFSSTKPLTIGPKRYHESRSSPTFWPYLSAPAPAHVWLGLGYIFERLVDGWQFRICLPFWFLLLPLSALPIYILRRARRPAPLLSAFPVEPLSP
jgi:hypothetical protein